MISSTNKGYDKEVVVCRLKATAEHFGGRRVWNHSRTARIGNVPQATSAVEGAGQQTVIQ